MTGISVTTASLNGVPIGAGSAYRFTAEPSSTGVQNLSSKMSIPFSDGARYLGASRLDVVEWAFEVRMRGTQAEINVLAHALKAAWGPVRSGIKMLTVSIGGVTQVTFGRPVSCEIDMAESRFGTARARCVFEATDPRMFSASESAIVLGLNPGGGMTFPMSFPMSFGAGSSSDGTAINAGTFETNWTATIVGPVTTPRITLGSTGEFVELDLSAPAGSTVVVSSADGLVLLNGSPRQASVTLLSRFFVLPPGPNTIRFRAASGTGSCTFAWRDAWL